MTFTYSICHPDKKEIECITKVISSNEVLEIATNYSWIQKLNLLDSISPDQIYFNPSLDFKNTANGKSFCLTAHYDEHKNPMFSLWYNRPKKVKVLFGLLGESEKMVVDDFWSLNLDESLKYLKFFLEGKYSEIEALFKK
ncbi:MULTISPECIES: hypothetical protein [Flavobacterium]|uniref:hypothetical protein n=1 Tax=Flavobacterium TaxID=237 RepID=UPI001182BC3F|nr:MULTISPECIES: hypothetical protein [Flavobacterium]MCR4030097.1 hypothetical protein [Flavobacterium panacis]